MTPQPQQQEDSLDDEIDAVIFMVNCGDRKAIRNVLRSRPAPSPDDYLKAYNDGQKSIAEKIPGVVAEAAAQAREKVLKEISESLETCAFYDEMISGEGSCLGKRNGEPSCDGCSYFEIDGNQLRATIESPRTGGEPR